MKPITKTLTTLLLLGAGIVLLALAANNASAATLTVDDNGGAEYTKIQNAIDNATDGDTIRVWEGTYKENLVVCKSIDLIGNGSEVTTIDAGGRGDVVNISADNVTISSFNITGSGGSNNYSGISVNSNYNTISSCTITANLNGIYIEGYNGNIITNNNVSNNRGWAISLDGSENNTIRNNTLQNNEKAIDVAYSSNYNILSHNFVSKNNRGINIHVSDHNLVSNNSVREQDRYGIWVFVSEKNIIEWNNCSNNGRQGIFLQGKNNSNYVLNNTCLNNSDSGIHLSQSSDNFISNNTCSRNENGIYLYDSSSGNQIMNNVISNNTSNGIKIFHCGNNQIHYNHIIGNYYGVHNDGTNSVDASRNYWGAADGPGGQGPGNGDNVSSYVDYEPWYATVTTTPATEFVEVRYNPVRAYSDTIQGGIDAANEGANIKVSAGTYYENIEVNKTLNLIGNGSVNTTIDGGGSGDVVKIEADWVDMSGFTVTGSGNYRSGIKVESDNNIISNNTCKNNDNGIHLSSSSNCTIRNNTISDNLVGVCLRSSSRDNAAHYNNIYNNTEYGIDASDNNGYKINATNNYWGATSGPYHPTKNPEGEGDNITDYVEFNGKPRAHIDSISPKPALDTDSISFEGHGTDDGTIERYAWRSSLDGEFYNGSESSLDYSTLSKGQHIIYLKVMDNYGIWSEEIAVELVIHQKPAAHIDSISPDPALAGEMISFRGHGTDDGSIERHVWTSSIDGEFINATDSSDFSHVPFLELFCTSSDEHCPSAEEASAGLKLEYGNSFNFVTMVCDVSDDADMRGGQYCVETYPAAVFDGAYRDDRTDGGGETLKERYEDHIRDCGIRYVPSIELSVEVADNHDGTMHVSYGARYADAYPFLDAHLRVYITEKESRWSDKDGQPIPYGFVAFAFNGDVRLPAQAEVTDGMDWRYDDYEHASFENFVVIAALFDKSTGVERYAVQSATTERAPDPPYETSLSPGTHTIRYLVMDNYGVWGHEVNETVIVHEKPVARIDSISPESPSTTDTVSFSGYGTDDGSITRYAWHSSLDNEFYNGTDAEFEYSGLSQGNHTIYFKVQDNYGIWSDEVSITLIITEYTPPNHKPTVTITSPANNSEISGKITISGTASDPDGAVERVEVSINGENWTSIAGITSWSFEWDTKELKNGDYTINVRSYDGTNYSEVKEITVTVENKDDGGGGGFIPGFGAVVVVGAVVICCGYYCRKRS